MRRVIILISLILAIGVALFYKYMIMVTPPVFVTADRGYGDVFQNIQFNNGYTGQPNLQEHYSNLQKLEMFNKNITRERLNEIGVSDSIQLGKAQLYYWLWETYSAAALLATKLSIDLYLGPPISVTNPKLPLHDVENLSTIASKIVNKALIKLSNKLDMENNSGELIKFMASQSNISECDSTVFSPPEATIQDDSNAFVVDPYVFGVYANCFRTKAMLAYKEILEGNNRTGSEYYKAYLQYLMLLGSDYGGTSLLTDNVNDKFILSLADSIQLGLYSDLLFDVTSLLLDKKILSFEKAHSIIKHSEFPYAELLLSLLSVNTFSESVIDVKAAQFPNWSEIVSLTDPILAPKLVENLAKYYDAQKEYSESSLLINNFWFADASNYPPKVWWFDNYPEFLIFSYAFGRLDGGRLPLWIDNLYRISRGDKLLGELMELAKYYNMVAFY